MVLDRVSIQHFDRKDVCWREHSSAACNSRDKDLNLIYSGSKSEFTFDTVVYPSIIAGNYYEPKLFWFELDLLQTRKLVDLFMSTPVLVRNSHLRTMAISKDIHTSTSDTSSIVADEYNAPKEERRDFEVNVECGLPNACTVGNSCATNTDKSWSSLFKPSSHSDTTGKGDIFVPQSMSQSLTQSDQSTGEIITPAISPSADDDFWEDPWNSANFNEPVNCSATSPSAVEGQQHGSWENLDDSVNFQESLDSSWRIPSSILSEIGQPSQPPSNSSRKDTQSNAVPNGTPLNTYNDIDTAPLLPRTRTDFADTNMVMTAKEYGSNSLDLLTHVAQLVQEINGLKVSQLEQNRRIRFLFFQQNILQVFSFIESKSEIQLLRNRSVLTPTPSTGSFDEVNFELPQKFPDQVDKSVYMVGGFNGSSWLSDMDSYCVSRDLMRPLSPMTFLRSYSSVTSLNGQLYVLGGALENLWYDTVEFYSPTTDKWGRLPSLSKKKGSMASASLYGNLYAIGGGDGVDVFSEVEMFDFNTGRWIWTHTMNQKASLVTLQKMLQIYNTLRNFREIFSLAKNRERRDLVLIQEKEMTKSWGLCTLKRMPSLQGH
ncbi:hypothetical protein Leryth_022464 [Lithospermum erythrorhizon]|nr:hypothetical protein Leryth_022464 [Lithospermum erythrorhizon]